MSLPTDRDARNAIPLWDGLFAYFPDVWAEIAKVSVLGNKQHGLGAKLFWNREVSTDHLNKVMRHCFDHGTGNVIDTDGTFHMAKAVWRACAELQLAIEARRPPPVDNAHVAPGCELFANAPSGWADANAKINPGDKITIGKPADGYGVVSKETRAAKQDAAFKKRQENY
jgi:hypothetical protein